MARSIVITSGKGGVGKSTVTLNLGRGLAALNQRVVLIDTDIGLNNLDVLMDVESKVCYDLIDVIQNRCRPRQALIEDKIQSGLFIMPSAHSYDAAVVSGQNLRALVNVLSQSFDYVLVDCPAGIETGFHRAVQCVSEALVVTTPHISAIRDADKAIGLLKSYRINKIGLIVNRARGDQILNAETVGADDIANLLKVPAVGIIPEDDAINLISNLGLMVDAKSKGFKAFEILAGNVHYDKNEIFDVTKQYKGFFGGIKKILKKIG